MTLDQLPETLTTAQVAKLAKVSVATVTRWVHRGRLKPVEHNPVLDHHPRYIFRREDVARVLEPLYKAS